MTNRDSFDVDAIQPFVSGSVDSLSATIPEVLKVKGITRDDAHVVTVANEPFGELLNVALGAAEKRRITMVDEDNPHGPYGVPVGVAVPSSAARRSRAWSAMTESGLVSIDASYHRRAASRSAGSRDSYNRPR